MYTHTHTHTEAEKEYARAQSLQQCLALCDPMDCDPIDSLCPGKTTGRGLTFLPPGDLSDPGLEPMPPASLALQVDSLPTEPPGKPKEKERVKQRERDRDKQTFARALPRSGQDGK